MTLSYKQREFARLVAHGETKRGAAAKAGYSERTANSAAARLLQNAEVVSEIDRIRAELAQDTAITAEYVIARLRIEAEREGPGSQHSARVRALELLGRVTGVIRDRMEVDGEVVHLHGVLPPEMRRVALRAMAELPEDTPDEIVEAHVLSALPAVQDDRRS